MAWEHFLDWFSSSFMLFTTEQQGGRMMPHLVSTWYDFSLESQRKFKRKSCSFQYIHTQLSWDFFSFSFYFLKGITCFHIALISCWIELLEIITAIVVDLMYMIITSLKKQMVHVIEWDVVESCRKLLWEDPISSFDSIMYRFWKTKNHQIWAIVIEDQTSNHTFKRLNYLSTIPHRVGIYLYGLTSLFYCPFWWTPGTMKHINIDLYFLDILMLINTN
jgi:hypothetical protein